MSFLTVSRQKGSKIQARCAYVVRSGRRGCWTKLCQVPWFTSWNIVRINLDFSSKDGSRLLSRWWWFNVKHCI
jgi:hypothetical protein